MPTPTPVLKPVKLSAAMRRKLNEFKGERSILATTKNGSRNTHPTIKALEARGLVEIHRRGTDTAVAVLTEQGDMWMCVVERAEAIYAQRYGNDDERFHAHPDPTCSYNSVCQDTPDPGSIDGVCTYHRADTERYDDGEAFPR